METKNKDSDEYYDRRKKNADEMYCYSCGNIAKQQAAVCPSCGVTLSYPYIYVKLATTRTPKEKETAMFLAFFTSFFVWLYLYEKSFVKFWGGFAVCVACGIIAITFFAYGVAHWYFAFVPLGCVWLFAIIDIVRRDSSYFASYNSTLISKGGE